MDPFEQATCAAEMEAPIHPPLQLASALRAWRGALGDCAVAEGVAAQAASRTTYQLHSAAWAVLSPASAAQVALALKIAREHGIPVLPVSSGLNWGYGSRVPVRPGVVMSLVRLDRILGYDDRLGWVRVQAGVTQAQLYAFLQERGGRFWMDATGSAPAASVLSNALERGFGHTPSSDHFGQCCDLEVVLPDGQMLRTGFGAIPGCHGAPVYRYGLGPVVDGLFSQSTLGVVTEATLWLMPRPESFQAFSLSVSRDDQLPALVGAIAQARLEGTLAQPIHLGNDYKVLASVAAYPFSEVPPGQALAGEVLQRMCRVHAVSAWSGLGAVYGTRRQTSAALARIRGLLSDTEARCIRITPLRLRWAAMLAPWIRRWTGVELAPALATAGPIYRLLQGEPTNAFVKSAYWRMRKPPAQGQSLNPDLDGVGLRWLAPVAPATPEHVARLVALASDTLLAHGMEPLLTLNFIGPRAVALVTGLTWDRSDPDEDTRADRAFSALVAVTTGAGYWPYRGSTGMQLPLTDPLSILRSAGETSVLLGRSL